MDIIGIEIEQNSKLTYHIKTQHTKTHTPHSIACPTIPELIYFQNTVDKLVQRANASLLIGTSSWAEQFAEAITVSAGMSCCRVLRHIVVALNYHGYFAVYIFDWLLIISPGVKSSCNLM